MLWTAVSFAPHLRLVFSEMSPQLTLGTEFQSFVRPYGATLLTMIKIVLIAAISFAIA